MPSQITMFQCNECKSTYHNFNDAMKCETTPSEPDGLPIGSSITFENEENLIAGGRYSYYTLSGIILYKYKALVNDSGHPIHKWVYVVSIPEMHVEMEVMMAKDDLGLIRPISFAEKKFKPGYAASLQNTGCFI